MTKSTKSKAKQDYKVNYSNIPDDDYTELVVDHTVNDLTGGKKTWVRNSHPVTMSLDDDDSDRSKKKAEIFNKLWRIKNKRGVAKFSNTAEMEFLIEQYFEDCAEEGIRPTIRGLAAALGTVYSTLNDWEAGTRDKQLGSECSAVIKNAKQFIAEFDEQMALEGLDNPVLFMFRAKNYYQMADKQEISVTPQQQTDTKSMEQLAAEIPEIPIDEEE